MQHDNTDLAIVQDIYVYSGGSLGMTACSPFFEKPDGPKKFKGGFCTDFFATGTDSNFLNQWFTGSSKLESLYKEYMFFTEDEFTKANDYNNSALITKDMLSKVLF